MSQQVSHEIGGYFGLEEFTGKEYHENLIGVNTARNALACVLQARQVKKLYIPAFLCDCVERVCQREGFAYEKYNVGADFMPLFDGVPGEGEWVYVVNYYGQIPDTSLQTMQAKWGRILVDHVQDFFRKPLPGVDTVYSCRKFFGVPDGAYLATDAPCPLQPDFSRHRMEHVLGRFETTGSQYFSVFQENDEQLYDLPVGQMSPITRNLLRAVDYAQVEKKRTENFSLLAQLLGGRNRITPVCVPGAYCYPFYCEDGMAVKKLLAQQKIYVATLWPNVLEDPAATDTERAMARNILPLPCDQRYTEQDMRRMAELINAILSQ